MPVNKFHILIIALLSAFSLSAATYSVDELPNVQVQDYTKHLVDPDGIISPAVAAQIDSLLLDGRRKSSAEIVAVIVDDIDTDDIDTYATTLFRKWGIGKADKNNGILIIVAKDGHAATIRTGYGAEGVLPDILAGRIVYDTMIPHFREDDYEGGLLAGVQEVHRLVTDPDAVAELMSSQGDNYSPGGGGPDITFRGYLTVGICVAVLMLLAVVGLLIYANRKDKPMTDNQKSQFLRDWQLPLWVGALIFIGIPILAPIILMLLSRYYRNRPRKCPRCQSMMHKLNEQEDNKYLNYAQDLEERINSVDYDVWLCPKCGEKDIYSFINRASSYHQCPHCKARTERLTGTRIITEPTYSRQGVGEKQYECLNCGNHRGERYTIAKKEKPVVVASGFGGGRGGGGFGGGFGGGLTGGGGATGRW